MADGFTPGAWSVDKDEPRKVVSDGLYGTDPLTGENLVGGASQGPYAIGNARLIAAAPEMLAALKSLVDNPAFELGEPKIVGRVGTDKRAAAASAWEGFVESARAAIAKAEGR